MGSRTVIQKFNLSNWPRDLAVRLFLLDKNRVPDTDDLWVETCGEIITLSPLLFDISDPEIWKIDGIIAVFPARRQHNGSPFTLVVPRAFWNRNTAATFEVELPLLPNKTCECCDDGTVYEFNDDGYICPACGHGRPSIRLWKKPEPHGTYPPMCMQCGVRKIRAGSTFACPQCGSVGF